eukprot:GAHX01002066.1.p1 GENE.GAHX01002066.1~~GAHX01002066.1.p1  ORF type:complete len:496 (+),score=96.36 GAHX01002066.1:68-1555(+)
MQSISRLFSSLGNLFDSRHPMIKGVNDILVIRNVETQKLSSTPFHIKVDTNILRSDIPKQLAIYVNDVKMDFEMDLDSEGNGYFKLTREQINDLNITKDIISSESEDEENFSTYAESLHLINSTVFKDKQNEFIKLLSNGDVSFSLCKSKLTGSFIGDLEEFNALKIDFETFEKIPEIIFSEECIILLNSEPPVFAPASTFLGIIASKMFFGKQINMESIKKSFRRFYHFISREDNSLDDSLEKSTGMFNWKKKEEKEDTATKSSRKVILAPTNYLEKMNLKEGKNVIRFALIFSPGNETSIESHIFFYASDDKFIVSDIDGTITKSDLIGHMAPFVGMSYWINEKLLTLFKKIKQNQYRFIYLTSRPLDYSSATRTYINTAEINGLKLPDGPVFCVPYSFLNALKSEIVNKRQNLLKTELIREILVPFDENNDPLFAGFGNQQSDFQAYTNSKINKGRVFILKDKNTIMNSYMFFNRDINGLIKDYEDIFPEYK